MNDHWRKNTIISKNSWGTGAALGFVIGISGAAIGKIENNAMKYGPQPDLVIKVAKGSNLLLAFNMETMPVRLVLLSLLSDCPQFR